MRATGASYPFSVATNITADIEGVADGRPGTWGKAGFTLNNIVFAPPSGKRVRILRVYGSLNVMPKVETPPVTFDPGCAAGFLWGLQTTAGEGSALANPVADNTMIYLQDQVVGMAGATIPFDHDVSLAGRLEADAVLVSKFAVFLNTFPSGNPIHLEWSGNIVFRWEDA